MGSIDANSIAASDEKPQHVVYLPDYWIGHTEVTNLMFTRFVAATGYQTDAEKIGSAWTYDRSGRKWVDTPGANWRSPFGPASSLNGLEEHPVVQVSWNDAVAYCQWTGKRLPTEAEWEKAARGGDGRSFPWGNEWDLSRANSRETGRYATSVVGSYPSGGESIRRARHGGQCLGMGFRLVQRQYIQSGALRESCRPQRRRSTSSCGAARGSIHATMYERRSATEAILMDG
ncbi:MAG: SUMF1/EgtB/PvdO family nonheme iron enzyme [Anaerolineae bacterium]